MKSANKNFEAKILFRTDASASIGSGHLMRCLALAEICKEQSKKAVFAMHECPEDLLSKLNRCEVDLIMLSDGSDSTEIYSLIEQLHPSGIVIDGYSFDEHYRQTLFNSGIPVLALDDGTSHIPLHADIVLNSSPLACEVDYKSIAPSARLLLGPAYAPLRNEFRQNTQTYSSHLAGPPRVLVTFGGSDTLELTTPVVKELLKTLPTHILLDVVIGGAVIDDSNIVQLAQENKERITLHKNTPDMAVLMRHASIAVAAAGSTLWELAYLTVPTIAVVAADNQAGILKPPLRDWFYTIDARSHIDSAVTHIALACLSFCHDDNICKERRNVLSRIKIGQKTDNVFKFFDNPLQRAS